MPVERIAHSRITRKFQLDSKQLVFRKGEGGRVEDADGGTYVDFVLGYGPVILGHSDPAFQELVVTYLDNGLMMPGYTTFHEEYLERLLAGRPGARGAPFKTGSEAVTASLRIAAMETGRLGVVRSGYVGWHDSQIANSLKWHEPLHSPLRTKLRYTTGMRGVGPDEPVVNWVDLRLDSLEALLAAHEGKLGCFVFDAYLASLTTPDVLRGAIERCRRAGLLVVFDETKTGGRISRLGYAHDHGLEVDLIVIGKALANGAPLSLLVGPPELLAAAERSRLSGTFSKEMFAMYSALATLEVMQRPAAEHADGWSALGSVGRSVAEAFSTAAAEAGLSAHIWAQPVLGGGMFELAYGEDVIGHKGLRDALLEHMTAAGILMLEGHPSFVALAHGRMDLGEIRERAHGAFLSWRRDVDGAL